MTWCSDDFIVQFCCYMPLKELYYGNKLLKMMKRNHVVVVLNILIWCQNQQTTDTNLNRNQKTKSWVTCQSNTFDIFMYSIYCIEKVQKVQKDWKNECQKHESSIFFVPIFILLFIFPRFFIFIMWCSEVFSLLTSNEKKCRKSDSQKWTLISIKLQKITLFSLMYPMSCTYTMNGMNAVISYVCEWNSNINVQCSKFDMLGERRWISNVIYFIGNFCHVILPDTDRLHLVYAIFYTVPTCTFYDIIQNRMECVWVSLSL